MKALSIRQPWAWLIVHAHKPVENRTWTTRFRGSVLIHAGKSLDKAGYQWVRDNFPEIQLPEQFERGGIVGTANLFDVVTASDSPWFFGPVGFCLRDARPLPFAPLLGKLGFFEVEPTLLNGEVSMHPDAGGSVEGFQELTEARERLRGGA